MIDWDTKLGLLFCAYIYFLSPKYVCRNIWSKNITYKFLGSNAELILSWPFEDYLNMYVYSVTDMQNTSLPVQLLVYLAYAI